MHGNRGMRVRQGGSCEHRSLVGDTLWTLMRFFAEFTKRLPEVADKATEALWPVIPSALPVNQRETFRAYLRVFLADVLLDGFENYARTCRTAFEAQVCGWLDGSAALQQEVNEYISQLEKQFSDDAQTGFT